MRVFALINFFFFFWSLLTVFQTAEASGLQLPKNNKHTHNKVRLNSWLALLVYLLLIFFVSNYLFLMSTQETNCRSQESFANPMSSTHKFLRACSACFPRKGAITLHSLRGNQNGNGGFVCILKQFQLILVCSFQLQGPMLLFTSLIWSTSANKTFYYVSVRGAFNLSGPKWGHFLKCCRSVGHLFYVKVRQFQSLFLHCCF